MNFTQFLKAYEADNLNLGRNTGFHNRLRILGAIDLMLALHWTHGEAFTEQLANEIDADEFIRLMNDTPGFDKIEVKDETH